MALPIKFGLAALGAAGASASVYYGGSLLLDKPETKKQEEITMPSGRPLVQDTEFGSDSSVNTIYQGKNGEKYAGLLVGTGTAKSDAKVQDNKKWGDWAYSNVYKQNDAKGGFKTVGKGSKEGDDGSSLQEVCDKAYKAETSNVIETDPGDGETEKFKEEQLWKFCSAVGKKPKSISDMTDQNDQDKKNVEESNGIGKDKLGGKNKTSLLAIHAPDNTDIWEKLDIRFKEDKPTSGFFVTATNGNKIKDICEKAYGVDAFQTDGASTDDGSKPKEAEFYKGCSLKGHK